MVHLTWYTAISRKVVGKNVYTTIPKGNMGYDLLLKLQLSKLLLLLSFSTCKHIRQCPLLSFFQTSLENSELKTTHNTFVGKEMSAA